mgnify:CR=1 FL=1
MSKRAIGIAVIVLVTLLSSAAIGKSAAATVVDTVAVTVGTVSTARHWRRAPARLRPRAFWRWTPRRRPVRHIPLVLAGRFSRRSRFCRAWRPELQPDPERRGRLGKRPQRDEFAVARRWMAERTHAQQSRGARAARRRSRYRRLACMAAAASGWWQHGNGGYGMGWSAVLAVRLSRHL